MPSALRFRVPVQGAGIGPHQENQVEWSHVYNLAGAANGYTKWSRQWNLTGFSHDTEYLMRLRNRGSGGRHLTVLKSTDASTVLQVLDAGLTTPLQITSTLATGTAPFVVASTTMVTNLNANYLQGKQASEFMTQAEADLRYLQLTGGTISGNLAITGTLNVDGAVTLGNAITDAVSIPGTLAVTGGSTLGVLSAGATTVTTFSATGAASFDSAVTLGNSSGDAITVTGTATFGQTPLFSASVDVQGGTSGQVRAGAVIVNQSSLDGSEELLVNGQSKLKGDVTITTGTFRHESGGTARIVANSTGLGFFNSTPIARPTVVGSRGGNAALQSLCSELANLGLITDLTT